MKKVLAIVLALISIFGLAACGSKEASPAESGSYQYITPDELKTAVEGENSYILLDVRKAEDYASNHIVGSYSADVDSTVSGEDDDTSKSNIKTALSQATDSETGNPDDKYVLICYSGKRYAEAATGFMVEMGVPASNIYTLEGGMKAWSNGGDAYNALLEGSAN